MKRNDTTPVVIGRVWSLAITLMLLLSVLPALASPVAAQGTVTLTVTTVSAESGTPMPFVRIRATSSDGTVYGPRETGLPGTVSFDIDVTSAEMTVTVDVETPIACGVMPDPQVIGPFVGGETPTVNFSIATDPNCDLGTLAVYAYDCPDGFDATATDYQTWSTGCAEVRNNVQFTFTMLSNNQTWTPVTGQWGLPARAPIVGLPPGAYTMQESNPAPGQDSVFFCYVYATPDFVTSPNPTSIDRVDAPGGVATVNLNNNRISCDVFQVDAPEEGSEPTATSEGDGQVIVPPVAIGTATTLDELNLRAGPSGDAEILLEMPAGVTVEILGDPQNGFYPVRYQGQDGWAGGDFLGFGQEPPQPTATDVTEVQPAEPTATETTQAVAPILPVEPVGSATTTSDVNLRDAPTATGSNVLLVLPGGAVVDLLGDPENGFYPVRYNGQSGWVSGDFLQINAEGGEEPTATATATIGVLPTSTAVDVPNPDSPVGSAVTNDSVNFRNGPSSDAAVLFELPAGAAVDLLGDALNGFFPVLFEGQGGWVSEIFLDVVPPTATATATSEPTFTATAQPTQTTAPIGVAFTTSDVNMRSAPDVGSAILTVLLPNTQVDLLGAEVNGFLPIRYNGQDGFVSAQFMSIGAPATATATIGAAAEDSATLELHKSLCLAGYVPGDTIYNDCHGNGLADAIFIVEGEGGGSWQDMTVLANTPGPGVVTFADLPPGNFTIHENVPGEFTSIFVYCSMADSDEVVPFTYNDAVQGIDITLAAGQSVICDWYKIPDDQGTGSIELHKLLCPAGYVPGDTIYNDCHGNGLADVIFTVEGEGGGSWQDMTVLANTPGPGVVTFADLPPGNFTIYENVPGDFTSIFVYCSMADSDEVVPFTYNDAVQGIDMALAAGQSVICDWYNIPDDQGTGSIELHKALCDPGYVPGPGIYDECHGQGLAGVSFTINGPSGFTDQANTIITQSPGPGIVTFEGLFAGTFTLTENYSGGDIGISVFCSMANSDEIVPFTYTDGGIQVTLVAGQQIICDWYNTQEEADEGTVIVHKRTCPVGYDDDAADFDDFYTDCVTRTDDVIFTLTPNGGLAMTRETGDDGSGRAVFTGLGTGQFTLGEDLPGEFVTRYAYCGPDDKNLSATAVVNGDVQLTLTDGQPDAVCLWFNVPEDLSGLTGQISLTKYVCPAGTTSNYWQKCSPTPLKGATFLLNGPGENDGSLVTPANGNVVFGDLPAGNYTIQEVPPAGVDVAVYVVACQLGGSAYKFTYDDSNGMKIKLNLPPGETIYCNWYNVRKTTPIEPPPVTNNKGSITVHKFVCTGKAASQYDWENDCLVQTSPEGFALNNLSGTRLSQGTTNANGLLVFTGLANGTYKLDETTGDWCHAEADYVDAAGNLIVKNSGNTNVYIYNCGAGQVGTLPTTGTGTTALESASASLFMPAAGALATLIVLGFLTALRRKPARRAV